MSGANNLPPANSCQCHAKNTDLLLQIMKTTADTTWALAEEVRLKAKAKAAEATRQTSDSTVVGPEQSPGRSGVTGIGAKVISERVGSISLKEWDALSEERLRVSDDTLNRIVTKISAPGNSISWVAIGATIHQELATFGFHFDTSESYAAGHKTRTWTESRVVALRPRARIMIGSEACRAELGTGWYTDEMIRIVHRLMELRDF